MRVFVLFNYVISFQFDVLQTQNATYRKRARLNWVCIYALEWNWLEIRNFQFESSENGWRRLHLPVSPPPTNSKIDKIPFSTENNGRASCEARSLVLHAIHFEMLNVWNVFFITNPQSFGDKSRVASRFANASVQRRASLDRLEKKKKVSR